VPRWLNFIGSLLDPRSYLQLLRLVHYYAYSHARERGKMTLGRGVRLAPNVSISNGERIEIGPFARIGARCTLWAGDSTGRISIGEHALFAPEVFLTASNYAFDLGEPVTQQPKREEDIVIGRDVWLGARVIVVAGVTIGDGCIVGAGSVVTRSLDPYTIAVGSPARPVGTRRRPTTEAQADRPTALAGA